MARVTAQSPAEKATPESTPALPDLVSLRAISNGALKGDELPKRIKIFNWGDNDSIKGTFKVGEKSFAALATNQRARGYERVALDYNHSSVPGSPEYEALLKHGQPPIIFGSGRPNLIRGDGLYLEEMEWTPLGVEKARNFEDLSPAAASQSGEIDFIHSVALTTNGCLHGVTFFSVDRSTGIIKTEPNPKDHFMSTENKNLITLAVLACALGLKAEATEADVTTELKTLSALKPLGELIQEGKVIVVKPGDLKDLTDRLAKIETANTAGIATLSATIDGKVVSFTAADVVTLAARVDKFEAALKAKSDADHATEAGKIITLLSAEGKAPVNPATGKAYTGDELKALPLPTLQILHANTPATVPLNARNKGVTDGTGTSGLKGRARMEAAFANERRN